MDPHRVLGVPCDAAPEEIHAAYRRLARRYHPDAGSVDDTRMAEINAAWHLLRDRPVAATGDAPHIEPTMVDAPQRAVRLFTKLLIIAAVLSVTAIAFVLLVGFGRLGVSPSP